MYDFFSENYTKNVRLGFSEIKYVVTLRPSWSQIYSVYNNLRWRVERFQSTSASNVVHVILSYHNTQYSDLHNDEVHSTPNTIEFTDFVFNCQQFTL